MNLSEGANHRPAPAEQADIYRFEVTRRLPPKKRAALGQYLTPLSVATYMASLFSDAPGDIILLDPGAGTGSLTAAFIQEMLHHPQSRRSRLISPTVPIPMLTETHCLLLSHIQEEPTQQANTHAERTVPNTT